MSRGKRSQLVLIAVLISVGVAYFVYARNRGVIGVQTSRVLRQDLTQQSPRMAKLSRRSTQTSARTLWAHRSITREGRSRARATC
jgi:cell division protein FtsB